MTYFAYLDEFGHIGSYIRRTDPRYKDSPVFGLAGFVLPAAEVRGFGTWFFQRKCELLDFEIKRSGEHPAVWEKKGANAFFKKLSYSIGGSWYSDVQRPTEEDQCAPIRWIFASASSTIAMPA